MVGWKNSAGDRPGAQAQEKFVRRAAVAEGASMGIRTQVERARKSRIAPPTSAPAVCREQALAVGAPSSRARSCKSLPACGKPSRTESAMELSMERTSFCDFGISESVGTRRLWRPVARLVLGPRACTFTVKTPTPIPTSLRQDVRQ